jgi:nucleoid DNA-binding protein
MKKKYSVKPITVEFGQITFAKFLEILSVERKIRVRGFGDFILKDIKARMGWNPGEQKMMKIPAYTKVCFKPDPRFRNYFN